MAGLGIFRRKFTIRRFGEEAVIDGYAHTSYEDTETPLNVQPLSADEIQALPEGERRIKRLKAYGDLTFTTADQSTGKRGDWLYYYGHWYECVSSLGWDHTMLAHCKSEFVEVPEAEAAPYDLSGPTSEDEECGCEWM